MDAKDIRNLQEAYLEVYDELDEGAAQKVADRAQKLANQRKGQTPQRKATYQSLASKADERANPKPEADWRTGMSDNIRKFRAGAKETEGKVKFKTTNPKKLRKQKAMGELGEQVDIYDIILSHLLDEGYAETPEAAERIMVNMSEEWRESIVEAEGSYGQTPKARQAMGKLVLSRQNKPASEYGARGEKTKQVGAAEKQTRRQDALAKGSSGGKKSSRPWGPAGRGKMTADDREELRSRSVEYGEGGTHGEGGITKNPKKLRKQKAMGEHD